MAQDLAQYTRAKLFGAVGRPIGVLARISPVAGEAGVADAERDLRGLPVKSCTEQRNWGRVGHNTPLSFVRTALEFPAFIQTQERHAVTNLRSNSAAWDFWSPAPEPLHQITTLMRDRGVPVSLRCMNSDGSHPYGSWNDAGERFRISSSTSRPGRATRG